MEVSVNQAWLRDDEMPLSNRMRGMESTDTGIATLLALIALSLLSLLGFYAALTASTAMHISDNFESHVRARYMALAGLSHAHELVRGLRLDDLLLGPDGIHDTSATYMAAARSFAYRNPINWSTARSLDIRNPGAHLFGISDDGLISTGRHGGANGMVLIPVQGIACLLANPSGGSRVVSRYSVKISDNNGESEELSGDPADDPFTDGDGLVIVRSMGIAGVLNDGREGQVSSNSVVVYEARFKRYSTFGLEAPLVVQGSDVQPCSGSMFSGDDFIIQGHATGPGLATIDPNLNDLLSPSEAVLAQLSADQRDNVRGAGATPAIHDITSAIAIDVEKRRLLEAVFLWDFIHASLPRFADNVFTGNQNWSGAAIPDLGFFDMSQAWNAPSQHPKVTIVNGDVDISGAVQGGGLLVITGKLSVTASFRFVGLILVSGNGEMDIQGPGVAIGGGVYLAALSNDGGTPVWRAPRITIGGDSRILYDRAAIEMAIRLIPVSQVSFREVTSSLDP